MDEQSSKYMSPSRKDDIPHPMTRYDGADPGGGSEEFNWLKNGYQKTFEQMNSTSASLDETIAYLKQIILDMNKRLGDIAEESAHIEALKAELSYVKDSLSDLETQKNSHSEALKAFEDFYRKNIQFMFIATETNVKLSDLETRLARTEGKADKAKDRSLSIWAIVISILLTTCTCVVSILIAILGRG